MCSDKIRDSGKGATRTSQIELYYSVLRSA